MAEQATILDRRADGIVRVRRDLLGKTRTGDTVLLGPDPDPYLASRSTRSLARTCLEILSTGGGARVHVLTRSDRVLRDTDVLASLAASSGAAVTVALATLSPGAARRLEPGAPSPRRRLDAIRRLRRAGIPVGLAISPVLPGITDRLSVLGRIVETGRTAGALWVSARGLRLPPAARRRFFALLGEWRPDLLARYRRRYGRAERPPRWWDERLSSMVASLRTDHDLARGPFADGAGEAASLQLHLPFRAGSTTTGYAVGEGVGRPSLPALVN